MEQEVVNISEEFDELLKELNECKKHTANPNFLNPNGQSKHLDVFRNEIETRDIQNVRLEQDLQAKLEIIQDYELKMKEFTECVTNLENS